MLMKTSGIIIKCRRISGINDSGIRDIANILKDLITLGFNKNRLHLVYKITLADNITLNVVY